MRRGRRKEKRGEVAEWGGEGGREGGAREGGREGRAREGEAREGGREEVIEEGKERREGQLAEWGWKEGGERGTDQSVRKTFPTAHLPLLAPAFVLSLQQGFFADEVAAGAGHTTTATLLHDLRLVSNGCINQWRFPVTLNDSKLV